MKKISIGFLCFIFLFLFAEIPDTKASTEVLEDTITTDTVWTKYGSPYIVYNKIEVAPGSTLTIEPGVVLKFVRAQSGISVYGTLRAEGTKEEKIYFTSYNDDSIGGDTNGDNRSILPRDKDWENIIFNQGSSGIFNHSVIRYAGYYLIAPCSGIVNNGGDVSISNTQLTKDGDDGISQWKGSMTITNSEISENGVGVSVVGGTLSISGSSIYNNSIYGLANYNEPNIISAQNNWWGSESGPFHETANTSGTGNGVYGLVDFMPFLSSDPLQPPAPVTLQEKAAALARQVITADYLGDGETYGGKGWDGKQSLYVTKDEIFNGYNFWNNKLRKVAFGAGLDCSGLIQWAFNRSFDPSKSLTKNVIRYDGADGQYRNNSTPIAESDLKPGDVLFLDNYQSGRATHVAMYVGEFTYDGETYDVVEAHSPQRGIVQATLEGFMARDGFSNLGASKAIRRVALSPKIAGQVKAGSPIDLSVTDPEGFTITASTSIQTDEEYLREIPGELYYSEEEIGSDGTPEDIVYWPVTKTGNYVVKVSPDSNATTNSTYSLDFTTGDNTISLAKNAPVNEISAAGYYIEVDEAGAIESSGEISIEYLLEKIRAHIQSFTANDNLKKPMFAMVDAIEKRIEVNRKLQDTLTKQIEKLKAKPRSEKAVRALEKQIQNLKDNEEAVLKELSVVEEKFAEKTGKNVTKKEAAELLKILTKVLITFH